MPPIQLLHIYQTVLSEYANLLHTCFLLASSGFPISVPVEELGNTQKVCLAQHLRQLIEMELEEC